jgi:TRAP-type C4-dicarboxylate transport system substrate-binding protein
MFRRLIYIATVLLVTGPVSAAPIQIKIATLAPENSSWMQGMRAGAREIGERTEGRVQLKLYGGGVMGNDKKVLRKMRIGQLHGASFTPSGITERYPDLNLYGLPLMFNSLDEVLAVREALDARLMAGLEEVGLVGFGITGAGFALIMSGEPVASYDDLKGRKVWVPEGDASTYGAMKALDLSPVVLPMTDVLTGLQTGLIEIIGTPPVGAIALQWYTKVKYVTDFPITYTYAVLVIEKKIFDQLEPADQAVVRDVFTALNDRFDVENRAENANARDALIANGLQMVEPAPGAVDVWRGRVAEINRAQVADGALSADLFEELQALLQAYRDGQPAAVADVSAGN